jgi:CheY-like chemotaxis protein
MSGATEAGSEAPEARPAVDVLIVEDDPDIAETLALMLEDRGYRTATAANGRDALEQLARGPRPSLILLDLTMPVMDGSQFRRAQLETSDVADIPVVVLTADATAERGSELNAPSWLVKPVALDALLAVVVRHCGARTDSV